MSQFGLPQCPRCLSYWTADYDSASIRCCDEAWLVTYEHRLASYRVLWGRYEAEMEHWRSEHQLWMQREPLWQQQHAAEYYRWRRRRSRLLWTSISVVVSSFFAAIWAYSPGFDWLGLSPGAVGWSAALATLLALVVLLRIAVTPRSEQPPGPPAQPTAEPPRSPAAARGPRATPQPPRRSSRAAGAGRN